MGVPNAAKILPSCSISVVPAKYGTRIINSAKMHPTDHKSIGGPYDAAPNNNSGERYHLKQVLQFQVPFFLEIIYHYNVTTFAVSLEFGLAKVLAKPKSANFKIPFESINKLFGFKS